MTFTVLSVKGQVVVPKNIREKLSLQPSARFQVQIVNESIVLTPAPLIDDVYGMFEARAPISNKVSKEAIKAQVARKFADK